MLKQRIAILLFCCSIFSMQAQIDTSFWFAAPDLTSGHQESPIRFCIASFDNPVTVTFEQPANPNYTPFVTNLAANSFYIYDVSSMIADVETQAISTAVNTGFHISSTDYITAYYEVVGNDSEIYALKGRNALGTDFIVSMQHRDPENNGYYPLPFPSIEIVATEDSTDVTIIPSANLYNGFMAGVPFTIRLNRGQSYAIKSAGQAVNQHLGNTIIRSNHPIAVNSTDDSVVQGGADLVGDQILPTSFAGNFFIPIWNGNYYESIFVFPTDSLNPTSIYIDHNPTPVATIPFGQYYMHTLTQEATIITTDYPVHVFQYTGSASEVGGTVIPQLECTGSKEVVYSRPNTSYYVTITILVKTLYINDFLFNGSTSVLTASDFLPVPADPNWSYCKKDVSDFVPINSLMSIENTVGNFHLGIVDESSGSCSYGFFSDYRGFSRINFDLNNRVQYCIGDTMQLDYRSQGVANIRMSGPNNYFVQDSIFVIPITSVQQAGYYVISGDDYIGCDSVLSDTVLIRIYEPEFTELSDTICRGETYSLNGFDIPTDDTWEQGIHEHNLRQSSLYGCDSLVTLRLLVVAPDTTRISDSTCQDYGYNRYGFAIDQTSTHSVGTLYDTLHVSNHFNCDSVVYLTLTILPNYSFDFEGTVCAGERYTDNGFNVSTSSEDATSDVFFQQHLQTTDGCDSILSLTLHVYAAPIPDFISTPEALLLSENEEIIFSNTTNTSLFGPNESISWTWNFDDGNADSTFNASHLFEEMGDYEITLSYETSPWGCNGQQTHVVHIEDDIYFPNVITPNGDGVNDVFAITNLNPTRPNRLTIYNRWGKKVFEEENYPTYAIDGTIYNGERGFQAEDLSDGVYFFTFVYEGYVRALEHHGTITVIR